MANHTVRKHEPTTQRSTPAHQVAKHTRIEHLSTFGESVSEAEMRLVSGGGKWDLSELSSTRYTGATSAQYESITIDAMRWISQVDV